MDELERRDDRIAQAQARAFLLLAAAALGVGCIVYLLILRLAVPEQIARMAGPAALLVVVAFALFCYRRGNVRAGLYALGVGVWLEITFMAWITGGIKAPALYLYPLIVLMAGWLLSLRAAYVFAAASVVSCLGLTLAESYGWLASVENRPLLPLVVQSGALIFLAVIVRRLVGGYQQRLAETRRLNLEIAEQVAALGRSEASYHDLFNTVRDAIYIQDRDGRFLDVNQGAVEMYGHPREAFIGRTPEFVSAPGRNDLAGVAEAVERALAGEPQRFEFWGQRANGEAFPKDVRLVRGQWFGKDVIIAVAEDITARKRAEEELRDSEEKFQKAFRASPIAIAITRLDDGCFLDLNDAWVQLFGWTREETLGRSSVETGHWLHVEDRLTWSERLGREGRVASHEVTQRNARGQLLQVLLSSEVIHLQGEVCALVLAIDQTERKRAELALRESRARLAEAQRIGHVGSWVFELDSGNMAWSEEMYRIHGRDPVSSAGSLEELFASAHPEDRTALQMVFSRLGAGPRRGEQIYRVVSPEGQIRTIHSRWEVAVDGQGAALRAMGTCQDISQAEAARAEVQRLNADLERRVALRTLELTHANRELESFAYSIAHDLRSPLRGIDGFSHLLLEQYQSGLDERGRDYLQRVRGAAQRMGLLIEDILELSRVTRQEMQRQRVDLSALAAEVIEEMAQARPEPRPTVAIAPDCVAEGDPQLLRLMLQNLLENAWKYSARSAAPEVVFGCEIQDGRTVYFVRDNGVGFDAQFAQRLFAPFQRLHKPEEFEGNGIGLATVARIVRRHQGEVWAVSQPGVETVFRFTLGGADSLKYRLDAHGADRAAGPGDHHADL